MNQKQAMKDELDELLELIPAEEENQDEEVQNEIMEEIEMFVEKYP